MFFVANETGVATSARTLGMSELLLQLCDPVSETPTTAGRSTFRNYDASPNRSTDLDKHDYWRVRFLFKVLLLMVLWSQLLVSTTPFYSAGLENSS